MVLVIEIIAIDPILLVWYGTSKCQVMVRIVVPCISFCLLGPVSDIYYIDFYGLI